MHQMMHSATVADESVEQTELRLAHYHLAKDAIFKQWLEFEKFKTLISLHMVVGILMRNLHYL